MNKKVKSTVAWTNVISNFKGEAIVVTFYKKEFQKTKQKGFRIQKIN